MFCITFGETLIFPALSLPIQLLLTQWGSWAKNVNYYVEYFSELKRFIFIKHTKHHYYIKESFAGKSHPTKYKLHPLPQLQVT